MRALALTHTLRTLKKKKKRSATKQTNCVFGTDFVLFLKLYFRFIDCIHPNIYTHKAHNT